MNKKRLLFGLVFTPIIIVLVVSGLITYFNVMTFEEAHKKEIITIEKRYFERNKEIITDKVRHVNDVIEHENRLIEKDLKHFLEDQTNIALTLTNNIYRTYKNTLSKEQIRKKIAEHLALIRFNNGRGYYYIFDYDTNIVIGHPVKAFIGQDFGNRVDIKGNNIIALQKESVKHSRIGFSKIYFHKPDDLTIEYPKLVTATKFEPLNIIIGTGEYLDVAVQHAQDRMLKRLASLKKEEDPYFLFIFSVHDLNGGRGFATRILNNGKTAMIGQRVDSDDVDTHGKKFREETLDKLRKTGEGYVTYTFKKPHSDALQQKLSYFLLQKDWNWIIGTGFYYDDLEKELRAAKDAAIKSRKKLIQESLFITSVILLISLLISYYLLQKIRKLIEGYQKTLEEKVITQTNEIRKKDHLLAQQSKMVEMGNMIGAIAHQWKQPLNIIGLMAQDLGDAYECNELGKEEIEHIESGIMEQVGFMAQTVDDFRNFFKPSVKAIDFSVSRQIQGIIDLLAPLLKKSNIAVRIFKENQTDDHIHGYATEFAQVALNLINNARDAIVEKIEKKELSGKSENYIDVFISSTEEAVKVQIRDYAGGIPEEVIDNIFDSYFSTKGEKGTGIGLDIAKSILSKMDATIKASNMENPDPSATNGLGKGALFEIVFKK